MEAIERVSAESVPSDRQWVASYTEAATSAEVVDPVLFDLPFDTRYEPNQPITWVAGYDLISQLPVWVPIDVVISPASGQICEGTETNGLAAGNTVVEAVVHALLELIERDAVSHARFSERYAEPRDSGILPIRMIDRATLPRLTRRWIERIVARGVSVYVRDLMHDLNVPVFESILDDRSFPAGPDLFTGYGADLDPARAVFRAVSEAVQSHTVLAIGARDSFDDETDSPARLASLWQRLDVLAPRRFHAFPASEPTRSSDLLVDLDQILARLRKAGCERCIVVDLTRPDLMVPVVRVLVPGLSHPYGSTSRRPGVRLLKRLA
jgi:ribosomal protein S12 methylthiotransferase accessory factor